MRYGLFDDARAFELGETLLRTLVDIHGEGRCHGNICPDSVRVGKDGSFVLLETAGRPSLEGGWQAFEAARGAPIPSSDIYQVGATLLFAVTGRPPSEAGLPFTYAEPRSVSLLGSEFRAAIAGLLRPDWRLRPKDSASALHGLRMHAGRARWRAKGPSLGFVLSAALIIALAVALAMIPSGRSVSESDRPRIADRLPGLAPRREPAFPIAGTRYESAVEAARARLTSGIPSGDLLFLAEHGALFVRGRKVQSGRGCSRNDGAYVDLTAERGALAAFPGRKPMPVELSAVGEDAKGCFISGDGSVWVWPGHRGPALVWREGAIRAMPDVLKGMAVRQVMEDASGGLWIYGEGRIMHFDGASWIERALLPEAGWGEFSLTPLGRGLVAAGVGTGLIISGPEGTVSFGERDGLQKPVSRIAADPAGRLLLMHTWNDGLTVLDGSGFRRRYHLQDGLLPSYEDVGIGADGSIWVIGHNQVLVIPPGGI